MSGALYACLTPDPTVASLPPPSVSGATRPLAQQAVRMRAAFLNDIEWPQFSEIRVFFFKTPFVHSTSGALIDPEYLHTKAYWVEKVVTQNYAGLVNLKFVWNVPQDQSNVRISFVQKLGSYSAVGISSLFRSPKSETMNLGWLDQYDSQDPEMRMTGAVVLHEFGHCLGLIHEHMRDVSETQIQWNKAYVYAKMAQPPNSWDKKTTDENIFDTFDRTKINGSVYDRSSIMHYVFPPDYFNPPRVLQKAKALSALDRETIRRKYPRPPPTAPPPPTGPPPPIRPIGAPPAPQPTPPRPIGTDGPIVPIISPVKPNGPDKPFPTTDPLPPPKDDDPLPPPKDDDPLPPPKDDDPLPPPKDDDPLPPPKDDDPLPLPEDDDPLPPPWDTDPLPPPDDIDQMLISGTYRCKESLTTLILYYIIPALALLLIIILSMRVCK